MKEGSIFGGKMLFNHSNFIKHQSSLRCGYNWKAQVDFEKRAEFFHLA